jgi:hypothetical protein
MMYYVAECPGASTMKPKAGSAGLAKAQTKSRNHAMARAGLGRPAPLRRVEPMIEQPALLRRGSAFEPEPSRAEPP